MSNTQHTPGPWSVSHKTGSLLNAEGVAFANFTKSPLLHEDMAANARLIAAAPDLLDALEFAEAWLDQYLTLKNHEPDAQCMLNVIRPALAKARGAA